ncbi:lipoprotein [Lentibacillus kapialis]|uniref:Lipoprotein n=1 Tax=Lentibacillus kapialis TaxID=340214 RepID=A0A917V0A8_9BACI|nr:YkyA family protein [Lentibacillus kapialis]GGK04161.1 lipoprotein [Lentibacillus kapialis]
MVPKKSLFFGLLILMIILSGCTGASTSEKIYNHLEKAVELEQSFEKQQDPIVELEQEEQEIYSQVIDLSMEEFDKIKKLSDKALDNIETRKEKINSEKESIDASKKEFTNIDDMVGNLEEEEVRKKADDMYQAMMDRYGAYDKLHNAYSDSLKLEEELYKMLKKEDLEQEKVSNHISKLNESYQKVIDTNKTFNKLTTEYNTLKQKFYKAAGIEVEYDEDTQKEKQNNKDGSNESDKKNESDQKEESGE